MKRYKPSNLGAAALLGATSLCPLHGQLIHRYSFDNDAGTATGGVLVDSVGSSDGIVQGEGAQFTGTGLDLPGGPSATQAYGDLPNNLISVHTAVSIEGWVTLEGAGNWVRIFDFGSSESDGVASTEITGPGDTNGGGNAGLDYLFLSASRGGDFNLQRVEVRDEDPAGGGLYTFDSGTETTFPQQIHFVVTWEDHGDGSSTVNYWRNGIKMTDDAVANSTLADLNDVNMWLGRSNYTADGNIDATFDEFRIYDAALTATQVEVSRDAGPDTLVDFAGDADGDLIPDAIENLYDFLDPNNGADAALDQDNDGLSNLKEYQIGTKLDDVDSDSDGLEDGAEVNTHKTLPLIPDTDSDGLLDGIEVNTTGTDPLDADSDDDGVNDGPEVAAGEDPKSAAATGPGLVHRYAFEAPAGDAPASTVITDLIGSANGIIVGNGAILTGTQLTLPGGVGATDDAAYVDFPNGLISPLDHLTFEAWYTVRAVSVWSHFWNFGSTAGGEITTGNTGATVAQDAFFFSHARGGNINNLRVGGRNLDPIALGGGTGPVDAVEENYDYDDLEAVVDQEYHIAATWTSDGKGGGQIVVYRDGLPAGSRTTTFTPRDLNDVNNWLGRSNWTADEYFNGDVNEFRIYNGVMNAAAAAASFAAGPDAAPGLGGPVITDIHYNKGNDTITLIFNSSPGRSYAVEWSPDLVGLDNEVAADIASGGDTTTYGPFPNPSPGAAKLFFRVSE